MNRGAASAAAALALVLSAASAPAITNRLHAIRGNSVDLEMSVDWDYDNPSSTTASREYITEALQTFAETTFAATEGRFRICKVFVRNKGHRKEDADLVLARNDDRAHATVGGLHGQAGQMNLFLYRHGAKRTAFALGRTMAHEFGHYGLSVMDEYTEPKAAGEGEQEYDEPRLCDVTLATLMGDTQESDGLSFPATYRESKFRPWLGGAAGADKRQRYQTCEGLTEAATGEEDATWRTAHYRRYRRSAWELIATPPPREPIPAEARDLPRVVQFDSIREGGVPDAHAPPAYDGACFQPVFLTGAFAVIAIDRSASMNAASGGPNNETLLDKAKGQAKFFISTLPAGVTVVLLQFSNEASVVVPATKLEEQSLAAQRAQLSASIDALTPSQGDTGLDYALDQAFNTLINGADVGNYQFVLAFTDGEVAVSDWLVNKYLGTAIPLFGMAADPSKLTTLKTAARYTRGDARGNAVWTFEAIEKHMRENERLFVRTYPKPAGQEPLEDPVQVSELEGATSFRAAWSGNDKVLFELVAPDGSVVTPSALPSGANYVQDGSSGQYSVPKPALGTWKPRLTPQSVLTGDLHLEVASESPLRLDVTVEGGAQYPDPWFVQARVSAAAPVLGAQVTGALSALPDGKPRSISFRDDGKAPDLQANDGVYSAVIADVVDDGEYSLRVSATNPGGARLDSSGVADEPGDQTPALPLSGFGRDQSTTLESKGFRPMPQTPAGALQVRNDLTPVWVTVNQPGDVVWLVFNGYAKGRYVAMTGALIANDDVPISTRLTLYDTDGSTPIASDAGADGRAWVELATPNQDGKYYLKVEHAGGGVGRFQVAVAPKEWFTANGAAADDDGGSACACGLPGGARGGSAAWSFALAGAVFLLRRRARR